MKKALLSFCGLLTLVILSCDKVKNPIVKKNTVVGSKFITRNNLAVSDSRKILLEDYTGMKCQNCPRAARTATTLVTQYQKDLIVIAVHTGGFSEPYGKYQSDFRTVTGDNWRAYYGVSGFPSGVINRKNYSSNGTAITDSKWSAVVSEAHNEPYIVRLNVITNYDSTVGALNVDVNAIFKKAYTEQIKISLIVIEDGITGIQLDGSVDIEDYEFEHMLRGAINGDWGSDLTTSSVKVNDSVSVSFKDFDLKNSFKYIIPNKDPAKEPTIKPILVNDKNVSVVAFAYDASTREVLQVEKVKIR